MSLYKVKFGTALRDVFGTVDGVGTQPPDTKSKEHGMTHLVYFLEHISVVTL